MLHKRYASPFFLLDNLIINEQFNEYVQFFLNKEAEEKNDAMLWEFFLHKVYDKSFKEWKEEIKSESQSKDATNEAKKEEIIAKSNAILQGFVPQQKEQKGGNGE